MNEKTLSVFVFLATIALLSVPVIMLASGAGTDTFGANVTITNSAPTIDTVTASSKAPTVPGGGTVISLNFNATDTNGVKNIVTASAFMNISRADEVTRTGSECWSLSNSSDGQTQNISCNITVLYYDEPGAWHICAYVTDGTANDSDCATADLTMGNLDEVNVIDTALTFTGLPGDTNVAASDNPLVINNTGNQNYIKLDITGYNLTGGDDTIGAAQFAINVTSNVGGNGQALSHSAAVEITSAALTKGEGTFSTEELYFYVDIPSGIAAVDYNTGGTPWMIDPSVS